MSDQGKAKKFPQYLAAVCICIGAMGAGIVISWTANITDKLKEGKLSDFEMDDDQLGWTGSCMTLGAMLICFPIGWIADWIGRKPTVLLTTIPIVSGWLLITFAKHISMVYIGRLLTGMSGGAFCIIAPLYTSEISETEIRGILGTFFQIFITIGVLFAQVFGYLVPLMPYNFMCLAVPLLFAILFVFEPETPIFLIRKGKSDKVAQSFRQLRGKNYDPSTEIKATEEEVAKEALHAGFCESIKSKAAKKATLICFTLMFYQQMSGINSVIFYANRIFTDAGSELAPHWCVIIIGMVQVIVAVFASMVVEKMGRKVLLMASCGFMGLSCFLLGLFFSLKDYEVLDDDGIKAIGFLPILAVIIFIAAFSLGLGPLPWLASAELFPPEIKAKCSAAAATFNWFLAFLVTRFYLNVASAVGTDVTFYFFCVVMITGIFFVLFVMPETNNKTFAQIQSELEGALGTGTVLAWTANITESLKDGELGNFKMNDDELGWTGSSMTLGAMIMCFPIGWIADWIGRKPTVLLTTIPFVAGWLVITFAQHISMVYLGRFLTGVAGGSFCVTAPLYTSEIGETEIRGRLGTFFQLFITIGILYAQVFGYIMPLMLYNFVCMGVPILFAIAFVFQPETPVFLVRKGKPSDKVAKAFHRVRGKNYDASAEIKGTEDQVAKEKQHNKFWDAMKSKASKKATLICFMLMFYQQMSGINAVIFYANRIFTESGSDLPPHWCVIIVGIVQVIATVFSAWSVEKIGRKILLMASCGLMALSCFLLGLFFSLKDNEVLDKHGLQDIAWLPVLSVIIFIMAFSFGLGPIPWMASSEIFPPEIKAKCSSAAATFNWFLAFLITRWYLNVATAIGTDITFYIFCIVMITGVIFVLLVIPETKNKTFSEIQEELQGNR